MVSDFATKGVVFNFRMLTLLSFVCFQRYRIYGPFNYRLLVWSDWGASDKIEMARMDGEDRKILVDSGLNKPRGITIDYTAER